MFYFIFHQFSPAQLKMFHSHITNAFSTTYFSEWTAYFIFHQFSPAQLKISFIHTLLKYVKRTSVGLALMVFSSVSLKKPNLSSFYLSFLQVDPSAEFPNSVNDVTNYQGAQVKKRELFSDCWFPKCSLWPSNVN